MTDLEKHKLAKAEAIVNEVMNCAAIIVKNAPIAFPPKRLFRKKGKRPLKRLQRQKALIALGLAPVMTTMQLAMIMAQPIQKYPPGSTTPCAIAIVGETAPNKKYYQMEQLHPQINILIRTSNRPAQFARCLESIRSQTYKNYHVIVGYDRASALDYIPHDVEKWSVSAYSHEQPYYYDIYCNCLKMAVESGWFFFLDDDDTLASNTVLEELAEHLTDPNEAVICQMLRNGVPKPADNYIRKKVIAEGKIGLPCLVLHSKHKALSGLDGYKAGDYRYIKAVTDQVSTKFICLPLVNAGARGHGKMEVNGNLSNISE
jgi:hypothetical protein